MILFIKTEKLDELIAEASEKCDTGIDTLFWLGKYDGFKKVKSLCRDASVVVDALKDITEKYVALVNCGDCGNWNPETENEVISARAALELLTDKP